MPGQARPTVPLADALLLTLQNAGPAVFVSLFKERATRFPEPAAAARSLLATVRGFADRVRRDGVRETAGRAVATAKQGVEWAAKAPERIQTSLAETRTYFESLPSAQDKAEYAGALVLYLLSFLAGLTVGFNVPPIDFKMHRKGAPGDRIVLHAFPLMVADLAAEWIATVFDQVKNSPLTPQDHRRAESLAQMASNLKAGLRTGAAALAWQKRNLGLLPLQGGKDVEVALQTKAFADAERLFRSLTDGSEK